MKNSVTKKEMDTLPKIVAIDFDGTLVEDHFPDIGSPNLEMFAMCKELREKGIKLILWTSRANDSPAKNLDAAVEYCKSQGLEFDSVNENLTEVKKMFGGDTRKVYADLYIDDKSIPHTMSPSYWAERLGLTFTLGRGIHDAS